MRTSGSRTTARPPAHNNAAVMAPRAWVPSRAEPVSSRTDSGSAPAAICAAAVWTNSVVLPVPGPPSTRRTPAPGRVNGAAGRSACGADMSA